MQFRRLGKTEERISVLGFGAMRLPVLDGKSTNIDEELATKMLRHAIDGGVNYVDTAFPYHGNDMTKPGQSEPFVGRALGGGYREKVHLATKLPSWIVESRAHMDEILAGQLERLRSERIDFYLVHSVNKQTFPRLVENGLFDFLEKAKADGRIGHVGFSYHENPQFFAGVVEAYDWEFCQIQYNYLDEDFQAGRDGLALAAEKDLGIIVMEPLRGGSLAKDLPPDVETIFAEAATKRSPAEWALRWVWNDGRVGTVLSGMTSMEHVVENLAVASAGEANSLDEEELAVVARVQDCFRSKRQIPCTACRYCMPCPAGVNIPECFTLYNKAHLTGNGFLETFVYKGTFSPEEKASSCVACGRCEEHCPQGIAIIEELEKVVAKFETPPATS